MIVPSFPVDPAATQQQIALEHLAFQDASQGPLVPEDFFAPGRPQRITCAKSLGACYGSCCFTEHPWAVCCGGNNVVTCAWSYLCLPCWKPDTYTKPQFICLPCCCPVAQLCVPCFCWATPEERCAAQRWCCNKGSVAAGRGPGSFYWKSPPTVSGGAAGPWASRMPWWCHGCFSHLPYCRGCSSGRSFDAAPPNAFARVMEACFGLADTCRCFRCCLMVSCSFMQGRARSVAASTHVCEPGIYAPNGEEFGGSWIFPSSFERLPTPPGTLGRDGQPLSTNVAEGAPGSRVIMWVHGGGNIGTMVRLYTSAVGFALADNTGQVVLMPAWPAASTEPWPAAVVQLCRCYRSLVRLYGATNVVVMGDSSGGGMALATLILGTSYLGEGNLPPPAGVGLSSPWAALSDAAGKTASAVKFDPVRDALGSLTLRPDTRYSRLFLAVAQVAGGYSPQNFVPTEEEPVAPLGWGDYLPSGLPAAFNLPGYAYATSARRDTDSLVSPNVATEAELGAAFTSGGVAPSSEPSRKPRVGGAARRCSARQRVGCARGARGVQRHDERARVCLGQGEHTHHTHALPRR